MATEDTDPARRMPAPGQGLRLVIPPPGAEPASPPRGAILIHSARSGGIWRVTRDGAFFGDYLREAPARQAAANLAQDVRRQGLQAELLFGPDD